ncbi:MAG: peptide/nickel transport system permease protein [Actinomycetota bacterium]|nr:peptide/nickel transport system permease protein [Actinomycetota bacterium]
MTLAPADVAPQEPSAATGSARGRGGLGAYAGRRLLTGVGTMFFVLVFNFFLFRLLPGDPIALYTRGRNMDREQLRELRRNLNQPIGTQFIDYLRNPFSSGVDSTQFSRPVWDVIGDYVWPTVVLLSTATVLSAVIGIAIGIRGGWKRGSTFDRTSTGITLTLYAMPEFWLGMVLLILFSVGVGPFPGIFPSGGTITPGLDPWSLEGILDQAWHLALPAATLTLAYLAEYALVMRSSLVDETRQEYLVTARAKGLMDKLVRRRHAVPNALLPTITLVFLNIGFVVSGAITVETVFSWPGLGLLSYQAIRGPDVPLLQAIFLLFSLSVVVANIVADIVVAAVDPRVRT